MLIQPAQTNVTSVTAYTGSVTPSGVERELARADIPPVEETEKSAGAQNRLFESSVSATTSAPADVTEDSPEQPPVSSQEDAPRNPAAQKEPSGNTQGTLSEEDLVVIDQLKARDREVRVHEAAHAAVGGRYAGSPSFEYTRGPDGRNYATGGEVSISVSEVAGDPQATIEKARVIRAAALAPAEPSVQDRRVAAEAAQLELTARSELRAVQSEESQQEKAERSERQQEAEADETVEETSSAAADAVAVAPVSVQPQPQEAEASESESATESTDDKPGNAREELEKILLGSQGLLQQANQLGLVNPENPYGKSGFLDIVV
ncbi:MAG: putative metalloprotease CJM1_0395 family protein [Pseudomonadota bacterium]|nr:putative metalloprotease CJM1_0395 family protein [Pseudomonadota bacterium]